MLSIKNIPCQQSHSFSARDAQIGHEGFFKQFQRLESRRWWKRKGRHESPGKSGQVSSKFQPMVLCRSKTGSYFDKRLLLYTESNDLAFRVDTREDLK